MKESIIKINTIDEYLLTLPNDIAKKMQNIRKTVQSLSPDAIEKISYWMPAFKLNNRIPTFVLNGNLVHFAAFKNHIGFYPGPLTIKTFENELIWYKLSKWTIQCPIGRILPIDLIKKIIKFRINEIKK